MRIQDIDLLIEVEEKDPLERGEKLLAIWEKLEEFFQRKVDLATQSSVRNPVIKKNIEATKVPCVSSGAFFDTLRCLLRMCDRNEWQT